MEKDKVISWLTDLCQGKDWFHSVGFDKFGRAVVYVKYMDGEVLRFVPDWTQDRKQVLCHFASSLPDVKNEFINKLHEMTYSPHGKTTFFSLEQVDAIELTSLSMLEGVVCRVDNDSTTFSSTKEKGRQLELSVHVLTDELSRLEKSCGTNILGEIFFEIHDKCNAITNLSVKYPEVRFVLEKLYNQYGFDPIYKELEL